jgi:peptidyl-prolyl cis-trans isomerase SurA
MRSVLLALPLVFACGGEPAKTPEKQAEPVKAEPEKKPEPEKQAEPARPPPDQKEACAQVLVVSWVGAEGGDASVNRDEATAKARAEELRGKLVSGTDIKVLAGESDEPKTRSKRGGLGTFEREKWPEKYAALADPVFALQVGEVTEPVKLPFGWVVARRCAIDKIHTSHILIRYKGAKNAETSPKKVKRDKAAAQKLAAEVLAEVNKPGADFAELARKYSEDSSFDRGGDLGSIGRGMFAVPYEDAAFALAKPGDTSAVVETDFGFHVIRRLD